MKIVEYNRALALAYARRYALSRNNAYLDFSNLGGDCTNFVSQCLYAGARKMNYTPIFGWYYQNGFNKAPAWSGVKEFYNFITNNLIVNKIGEGFGPFGEESSIRNLKAGDFIQLGRDKHAFYHSLIIVSFKGGMPLVASHSLDGYEKPLAEFNYNIARGIKILGVRV